MSFQYRYIIIFFVIMLLSEKVFSQSIFLPNDTSCVVNVQLPPFNAVGDGITDDTQAIQQAIDASITFNTTKAVYFPAGTYLISEPLEASIAGVTSSVGPWLIGENQYNTTITTTDNNPNFYTGIENDYIALLDVPCNNPLSPFAGHKTIENIGFKIGNNENACGIKMCGESSMIKNVRVSGQNVGAGIVLGNDIDNSSILGSNIIIKNTDVGFYCFNDLSNYTLSEILTIGTNTSILIEDAIVSIDNFVSLETGKIGLQANGASSNFTIVNSTIEFTDQAKQAGNVFEYQNFYARNINLINAPTLSATTPIYGIFNNDTTKIEEIYTAPIIKSQTTDYEGMLNIPVNTSPQIFMDTDVDNWVSVADFGADPSDDLDDSEAIQAAFDYAADNDKSTVYFPGCSVLNGDVYRLINQFITVSGSVNRVVGLGYAFLSGNGFIIEQNDAEVISFSHIHAFDISTPTTFENYDVNKISVFEDVVGVVVASGSGTVYVNNITGVIANQSATSTVYGRGINAYFYPTQEYIEGFVALINQEGQMWLSGVRAEHPYTVLATLQGGRSEVLGGVSYPYSLPDTPALFFTNEAETTIANFKIRGAAADGGNPNWVQDIDGTHFGGMVNTDATTANTITLYSDADGKNCPPDDTLCNDGNPFTTNDRYQNCDCIGDAVQIRGRVLLEGFFNEEDGEMSTNLSQMRLIPSEQPFNDAPFYYTGTEQSTSIPSYIVDWVLLELRSATDSSQVLQQRPAFISLGGRIIDAEGGYYIEGTTFNGITDGEYYLALYHKNHLPIISKNPIKIVNGTTSFVDFTIENSVLEHDQLKTINGTTQKAMYAGDFNQTGIINNLDYNVWELNNSAVNQYLAQDADGNGVINNLDFNLWFNNRSKLAPTLLHK